MRYRYCCCVDIREADGIFALIAEWDLREGLDEGVAGGVSLDGASIRSAKAARRFPLS